MLVQLQEARVQEAKSLNISNVPAFDSILLKRTKTHDFTDYENGSDYFFEPADRPSLVYMTGQGKGVRLGDYIIVQVNAQPERYQVESIDYYASPSDVWVALLKRVRN